MIFVRPQVNELKCFQNSRNFIRYCSKFKNSRNRKKFNSPTAGVDETIRWDLDGTYVNDALVKATDHRTINHRCTKTVPWSLIRHWRKTFKIGSRKTIIHLFGDAGCTCSDSSSSKISWYVLSYSWWCTPTVFGMYYSLESTILWSINFIPVVSIIFEFLNSEQHTNDNEICH